MSLAIAGAVVIAGAVLLWGVNPEEQEAQNTRFSSRSWHDNRNETPTEPNAPIRE